MDFDQEIDQITLVLDAPERRILPWMEIDL
jgi:hypothetical protein